MFYSEFCEISKNTFFIERLWTTACEFITETLILRSSRSHMCFKVSILKKFAMQEPLSNNKPSFTEHLRWLLLNFCDSKYFFVAEYGIYCWQSHRFGSSHQRCSVRENVLRNFAKLTGKHKWLFFNKVANQFVIFNPWKTPEELNSLLSKLICYITWLDATMGDLQRRSLRKILLFLWNNSLTV